MGQFFYIALLILVVIGLFNFIIFWHELGHFLAARWRGLKVERFQIWFGKPIWKKTVNGVQYGLGWIPAGGFVALPQMVTMESVEGTNQSEEPLPPVSPLDKMIVAFAGPLFSLMLALIAGFAVWGLGKPLDAIKSNVVGFVAPGQPAAEAGLKPGDKILKVDGEPVKWFAGGLFDDIRTRIMLTEGDDVTFTIERDGKVEDVISKFTIADTPFFKRRALPQVGIGPSYPSIVGKLIKDARGNTGPAEQAGFQVGDEIISVNGEKVYSPAHVSELVQAAGLEPVTLGIIRDSQNQSITVTAVKPVGDDYPNPMLGLVWDPDARFTTEIVNPGPFSQVGDSLRTMWLTIKTVASPKSNVGVDQLSGPVGIAKTKLLLLQQPDGWLRVLSFFVLFNVNLAVLNMLPFPVLDGGHIVMAALEWVRGKPLPSGFLEVVQTGFALLLLGFMLYVTTKDIGDEFGNGEKPKEKELIWPEPVPSGG